MHAARWLIALSLCAASCSQEAPAPKPAPPATPAAAITAKAATAPVAADADTDAPAFAQVEALEGEVLVIRGAAQRALRKGSQVREGDRLRAGADGSCTLVMDDGSKMRLQPHTEIVVRRHPLIENGSTVTLVFGILWNKVQRATGAHRRYEVQTRTAVAGVRGTEFRIAVTLAGETRVEVTEGEVEVAVSEPIADPTQPELPPVSRVRVKAGQRTRVQAKEAQAPVAIGGAALPADAAKTRAWVAEQRKAFKDRATAQLRRELERGEAARDSLRKLVDSIEDLLRRGAALEFAGLGQPAIARQLTAIGERAHAADAALASQLMWMRSALRELKLEGSAVAAAIGPVLGRLEGLEQSRRELHERLKPLRDGSVRKLVTHFASKGLSPPRPKPSAKPAPQIPQPTAAPPKSAPARVPPARPAMVPPPAIAPQTVATPKPAAPRKPAVEKPDARSAEERMREAERELDDMVRDSDAELQKMQRDADERMREKKKP